MNDLDRRVTNSVTQGDSWTTTSVAAPPVLDPLNVAIARLSDDEVTHMNREDLIDLVTYAVLDHLTIEDRAHLDFVEDSQLKRLACLARFASRRKVNSVFFARGLRCPFFDCI